MLSSNSQLKASLKHSAQTRAQLTHILKFNSRVKFKFCIAGAGVFLGPGAQAFSSSGVTSQAADGLLFILEGICPHGPQSCSFTPCFPWQMEHFFFGQSAKSGCLGSMAQAKDPPGSHRLWRLLMVSAHSWHRG